MYRKIITSIILTIFFITFLCSCTYHCDCDRNLGCKIISARQELNDTIRETKTFCSLTNYYTDQALQDSVTAFKNRNYLKGYYKIIERDSIYSYEHIRIKGGKQKPYAEKGYGCRCPK